MLNPVLSIVCPIWKLEGRLQNLRKWLFEISDLVQVVLVYDESPDNTLNELLEIIESHPNKVQIKLVTGVFRSPGAARNAGLKEVNGEWVCFWDGDDIGFPQVILDTLQKNRREVSERTTYCFGFMTTTPAGRVITWSRWMDSENSNLQEISLNPGLWRFCIPVKVAQSSKFSNLMMGEDQLYLAKIGIDKLPLVFKDAVSYHYFKNIDGQLTSSTPALSAISSSLEALMREQKKNPDQSIFIQRLLIRQSITAMRLVNTSTRTLGAKTFLIQFFRNPFLTIKQVFLILRSKADV
jgi:glycosyltransferase involved in cell wall biosynthesis